MDHIHLRSPLNAINMFYLFDDKVNKHVLSKDMFNVIRLSKYEYVLLD